MPGEFIFLAALGLGSSAAAYGVAALLHEGGHALAGRFFGARCLWIRVGGVLWVPGGGIFVRAGKKGRAGECALSCPDRKSCVAAALGGSLANLVAGAFSGGYFLGKMVYSPAASLVQVACVTAFLFCSLAMGVCNLWPGTAGSDGLDMGNDGKIAGRLWREEGFYKRWNQNQQRDVLRLEFGLLEEMF